MLAEKREDPAPRVVGRNLPRTDLAEKIFGGPAFLHDMSLEGMLHARVVRQPRPDATVRAIDEAAIRRAAKGPVEIVVIDHAEKPDAN